MERWADGQSMQALADAYGLRIRAVLPLRSVVGLLTDSGKWMCKRYTKKQGITVERLQAVAVVRAQLAAEGHGPAYLPTLQGESLWQYAGDPVTVEPWLAGRHADLSVSAERLAAVQAVARLHTARVLPPYALRHPPTLMQKLAWRLERADELFARGHLIGLTKVEWTLWRERAEETLRAISATELTELTAIDRARIIYCHRDLAPHNVLIKAGSPARLIDYDLSGVDTPIYDLHQLLGHIAFSVRGSSDYAAPMLQAYARLAPLSDRHAQVLVALAPFPGLLLRELGETCGARSAAAVRRATLRVRFAREIEERRWLSLARARRFVVC